MRILVIGGTGFIGAHVLRHLFDEGCALTSVFAPFRNLEIEWRQGKKTLSRDEPTNSRPNSKQPAKARQGLVLFSNGCHLNSSTDNLPCRDLLHLNRSASAPRL